MFVERQKSYSPTCLRKGDNWVWSLFRSGCCCCYGNGFINTIFSQTKARHKSITQTIIHLRQTNKCRQNIYRDMNKTFPVVWKKPVLRDSVVPERLGGTWVAQIPSGPQACKLKSVKSLTPTQHPGEHRMNHIQRIQSGSRACR